VPKKLLDQTYTIIGFSPIIGNAEVMHHMILFGCTKETPKSVRY